MLTQSPHQKINLIFGVLLISLLVIQTFSYSLPFYDDLVDGGMLQSLIGFIYIFRDICLFASLVIIVFYRALPKDSIVLMGITIFTLLLSFTIFPSNVKYFKDVLVYFILCVDVYLIIRSNLVNLEILKKTLRCFCYLLAVLSIYTFTTQVGTLYFIKHYMDYSNAVSIVTAILLYYGICKGKKIDLAFGGITYIILLIAGGRGAFLTLSLLIVSLIWLRYKSKVLIYLAIAIGFVLLLFPDLFVQLLLSISSVFDFESRTIERLLTSDLLRGSDRYELYKYLLDRSIDDLFLGGGICADRYYLDLGNLTDNGYYAHNILIELIVDFGFMGIFLFVYAIRLMINFIKKYQNDIDTCGFIFAYIAVSFVQLFFSRSWLTEPNLFMLIGLLIYYNNKNYDCHAQS